MSSHFFPSTRINEVQLMLMEKWYYSCQCKVSLDFTGNAATINNACVFVTVSWWYGKLRLNFCEIIYLQSVRYLFYLIHCTIRKIHSLIFLYWIRSWLMATARRSLGYYPNHNRMCILEEIKGKPSLQISDTSYVLCLLLLNAVIYCSLMKATLQP